MAAQSDRRYIRHPVNVPIELLRNAGASPDVAPLKNISLNGLSFCSRDPVPVGTWLTVRIPLVHPPFETEARTVWCNRIGDRYELGVELPNKEDAFRTRMVEQVCHIEEYRREVLATEGRELSAEQAAMEWIDRYASEFPQPD